MSKQITRSGVVLLALIVAGFFAVQSLTPSGSAGTIHAARDASLAVAALLAGLLILQVLDE